MRPCDADVEAIDRATVAALAPRIVLEDDGWLMSADNGRIGRANSVTPLSMGSDPLTDKIGRVEAFYAREGLPPAFRVADAIAFDVLGGALTDCGYAPFQPTLVKLGTVDGLLARLDDPPGDVRDQVDAAWAAAFGGEGFDPDDAASRVRALSRSSGAVYGGVCEGGAVHAVGAMSFGFGWAGIQGMRTVRSHRGRGLARRVLVALALAARSRGIQRLYLQVERENAPARALYDRAGFSPAWSYSHWRRAGSSATAGS